MKLFKYIRVVAVYLSLSLGGCKSNKMPSNPISPFEQKVDALTKVVERLLIESKAKDKTILDLEKRVLTLEKIQADESGPTTNLNQNPAMHQHAAYTRAEKDQKQEKNRTLITERVLKEPQEHDEREFQEPSEVYIQEQDLSNKNNYNSVHNEMEYGGYRHIIHKRVPEQPPPKVAFHVMLTSNEKSLTNKVITFQNITLDTANSYNKGDGIYLVPKSGIYVFTWTITSYVNSVASTELMINTGTALRTIADSQENGDYHTSTGINVANVNQGDHVYIKFTPTDLIGSIEYHYGQTSFSGWKLD